MLGPPTEEGNIRGRAVSTSIAVAALAVAAAMPAHATFPGQNGKIAFSNYSSSGIETIKPDGSGQTVLHEGSTPVWSPDGQSLLFIREADVRRMPANGSSETALLFASGFDPVGNGFSWQTPDWSPDGARITASKIGGTHDDYWLELHTASAVDGSAPQYIAAGMSPTWRPDGSLIAFSAHTGNGNRGGLHAIHPDGTGEFSIVEPAGWDPDYSPDGTKIVYTNSGPQREVYVVAGADAPVRLTNNTANDVEPVWSPDGTKIAFASNRDGNYEIYTMNADGTNQTRITNDPDMERTPDWQPLPTPYPRPKGATPVRVTLVPAYPFCASPNRTHGPPLAVDSCNPPAQESAQLTVGTSDANGAAPNMTGFVRYDTIVGNPATPADEADLALRVEITDVRVQGTLADYAGEVEAQAMTRMTDHEGAITATAADVRFPLTTQCSPTADTTIGSTCSLTTTLDTLIPGAVVERARTILQLGQVRVVDGGPDGDTATEPNTVFLRQGVFVP